MARITIDQHPHPRHWPLKRFCESLVRWAFRQRGMVWYSHQIQSDEEKSAMNRNQSICQVLGFRYGLPCGSRMLGAASGGWLPTHPHPPTPRPQIAQPDRPPPGGEVARVAGVGHIPLAAAGYIISAFASPTMPRSNSVGSRAGLALCQASASQHHQRKNGTICVDMSTIVPMPPRARRS